MHKILFPNTKQILLITTSIRANSTSSYRDSMNLCKIAKEKWNSYNIILTDNVNKINIKYHNEIYNLQKCNFLHKVEELVKKYSKNYDIIFCISGHGYNGSYNGSYNGYSTSRKSQYIRVNSKSITDIQITNSFYKNMDDSCRSMCFIDTCHSGTMMELPYRTNNGKTSKFIKQHNMSLFNSKSYVISACSDNELAGEDISYYGGFGGKLTCALLDYINKYSVINVFDFYNKTLNIFRKQRYQRSIPILSTSYNLFNIMIIKNLIINNFN